MLVIIIALFFSPIGETIADRDRCRECRGKKVTQETKLLEVHVDKGMHNGQKIPFRGEGDQMVGFAQKYALGHTK